MLARATNSQLACSNRKLFFRSVGGASLLRSRGELFGIFPYFHLKSLNSLPVWPLTCLFSGPAPPDSGFWCVLFRPRSHQRFLYIANGMPKWKNAG
jgi:hypothetical protein